MTCTLYIYFSRKFLYNFAPVPEFPELSIIEKFQVVGFRMEGFDCSPIKFTDEL